MSYIAPEEWRPEGGIYLEPNAWDALHAADRSICVVASAGAGKTEFLAQKASYLLQTNICPAPRRILAISFKRDAARNLQDRVRARCAPQLARRFDSLTFDAFTKSIIDRLSPALPGQFSKAANYEIAFPTRDHVNDFLQRHGAQSVTHKTLHDNIAAARLPLTTTPMTEWWRELIANWWSEGLNTTPATLTFAMINRLADYLVRTDNQIAAALRLTYPHVFLDEFQDTTDAQYELLTAIFQPGAAKLTAVGDDKQRIMVWAGAMEDGFERFQADFTAEEITLQSNFRSHEDLVLIQHAIAHRINPASAPPDARAQREVEGDVAAIWTYRTTDEECAGIAEWVSREVSEQALKPDDFAILVRMYADRAEEELAPRFQAQGLSLRNVARNVGNVAIQDTLAEELTDAVLPLFRLAAHDRSPANWVRAYDTQRDLRGVIDDDDDAEQRIRVDLEHFVIEFRRRLKAHAPANADIDALISFAIEFVGERALRRAVPAYRRDLDYIRVRRGLVELLKESASAAVDWRQALDRLEGIGQVSLMTIHKSKGLEFHTMLFMGLDAKSWWSLDPSKAEELKSFFVAFTRAKQRAFFTSCAGRGGAIGWIDKLLAPVGVQRIEGPG